MYVDAWQTLKHLCKTPNTSGWSRYPPGWPTPMGLTWTNLSQCIWIRFCSIFRDFPKALKAGWMTKRIQKCWKALGNGMGIPVSITPVTHTCTHHFLDISLVPFMATKKSTFWWRRARVQCDQVIKWERGLQGFSMLLKLEGIFED